MKNLIKIILLSILVGISSNAGANWFGNNNNWFGGNNRGFGNFFGNNRYGIDCNDWPEWTPMYWMEEMAGDKPDCDDLRYGGGYGVGNYYPSHRQLLNSGMGYGGYPNPYQSNRFINPYMNPYTNLNRYGGAYSGLPFNRFGNSGFNNPLSSFGGTTSPWSSYGSPFGGGFPAMSPLGGLGGFPAMSPLGGGFPGMSPLGGGFPGMSPLGGGFGSPFSPNPMSMGTMGMPGMSPLGGFGGGMPFGGSTFPFR